MLLGVVVGREGFLVAETLLHAVAAEEEEGGEEDQGDEYETKNKQKQVDHVVGAVEAVVGVRGKIGSRGGLGAAGHEVLGDVPAVQRGVSVVEDRPRVIR